ncbi:MAG: adenylosuccinate synthetase, partial [Erysipelothrix sp.]
MAKAIVGACWGDEGKGKITDMLADQCDIVIRYQGGSNAGHTIINEYGKFALHQLPSGVFHQNITNIIGNGVALSVENFTAELDTLIERGVPKPKLMVSDRCQIVMPYHKELDRLEEDRLSDQAFGSTKSGIAPFYSDKYAKLGFQVSELFDDEEVLRKKIDKVLEIKNVLYKNLYHVETLNPNEVYNKLMDYKVALAPYVADTFDYLYHAIKDHKEILLEGQLGSLKDPDHGIYPMVTSSSTLAGFASVGAGIPPYEIKEVITVVKAYSSAVGAGEFVSEIFGEE